MELAEIAEASLWIGKEMMESGADSATVEEAMLAFVSAHGFANAGVLVLPKSVLITLNFQDGFHTKMKHIEDVTPNFERLSMIFEYTTRPMAIQFDVFKTSVLDKKPPFHALSFFAVPIGCAAFGVLLGCDFYGALAVFLAAYLAFFVKSKVVKLGLSMMFVNLICAFLATLSAYIFSKTFGVHEIAFAQAASTFFLIPGIQLINTFEDMLKGHYLNGAARGLRAMFLSFGIVFGTTLAIVAQRSLTWIF
jgi:uncharacterized membrane protein YjjP (DUF1212 family)